jgi:8-oxo-dGTP pyrophosphatase MutT (NUDIX family)
MTEFPAWLVPLVDAIDDVQPEQLTRFLPPPDGSARRAAVLMLFGEQDGRPDLLLIERAHDMRSHPSHVAFPGGAEDPDDGGAVGAALREAAEETGLDPSGVVVLGDLPELYLPPSNFAVTPVVGWWRHPTEVSVVDPAEVASVHRVPIDELLDPANRYSVRHPSGFVGPAFVVRGLFVWGFTAGLMARLFSHVGWETPWDVDRYTALPDHMIDEIWRSR